MSRKYSLQSWDEDDPLNDPNARWRLDPATKRQILRLKFFGIAAPRGATKGDAAELLDAIEPTMEQLEDYEAWKAAGCPNIGQWHTRSRQTRPAGKSKKRGCFKWVLLLLAGPTFAAIVLPRLGQKPPERSKVPVATPRTEPTSTPAVSAAPTPRETPAAKKTVQIISPKKIYLSDGKSRILPPGTVVRVVATAGTTITGEFEGETFNLREGEWKQ